MFETFLAGLTLQLPFVVFILGSVAFPLWWKHGATKLPLPPGPPGHWLWGNDIPETKDYLKYHEWAQEYGPIYSLRSGRRTMIVIANNEAAVEILEKEGIHSADRPRTVAAGEMMSGNMRILLIGVGNRFRKLRKALHSHLQPKLVPTYEPLQLFNAKVLIRDILKNPEGHRKHARRYAASVILSLTYGKPSPSHPEDPDIPLINRCLVRIGRAVRPGAHIVDDLPWLKSVPFYGKQLRGYHREELALFRRQMQTTRDDIASKKAPPSFGKYLVERQHELELEDNEAAYLAGSMFGAGSETTGSAISVVIMAAACFPDAQTVVQNELDDVVGPNRLPSFGDADLLPQIEAFVLESFRWRPGSFSGFQHRSTKEIIYKGYRIPAGATLLPNNWSLARDPELFADAEKFDPRRWLNQQGQVRKDLKFPNFGFGRRICPGQYFAMNSLFINTALLLWSFRISQDPTRPIGTFDFTGGVLHSPEPFTAIFEQRLAGLHELINEDDS